MRKFLGYVLIVFVTLLSVFAVFIIWIAFTDYRPSEVLKLDIKGVSELSVLTWNIGMLVLGWIWIFL